MREKAPRIAVLHHVGGGNLGDDGSLEAVIRNIRERRPDAEIVSLSMNPEKTMQMHGIPAVALRSHTWGTGYTAGKTYEKRSALVRWLATTRNPLIRAARGLVREIGLVRHCWRIVRTLDQILIGGGGQLTGRSGPWGFPYSIFLWTTVARFAGVRRVFLNVGAGPLNSRWVCFLSVQSLRNAEYVSFRDARSQALLQSCGFRGSSFVFPDNAYGLQIPAQPVIEADRRPVLGIAPMPYPFCDPQEVAANHQAIYDDTIDKFARFAAGVSGDFCSIHLFGNDVGVDPRAIDDLRRVLMECYGLELPKYQRDSSVAQLLARTATLDYVVTCRFHGVVYAHLCNKPVIAVAHHPKVRTIMEELGLARYCFDIATFTPAHLTDAFHEMVANTQIIKNALADRLTLFRSRLRDQYDQLFPPEKVRPAVPTRPSPDLAIAGQRSAPAPF